MRSFLIAGRFLTRLPLPGARPAEAHEMSRSAMHFPLVGSLIGLVTAFTVQFGSKLWPLGVGVVLALTLEALLTGALHEDAVADFFDAFGGGWDREDVLRILKDSRLGSFGALALFFFVALRGGAMISLGDALVPAVVASAGLGRWTSVLLMASLPAVSDRTGLSTEVGRGVGLPQVFGGVLWTLPALAWLYLSRPWQTVLAIAALAVLVLGFRAVLRRRIGGTTGDCLGCLCYLAQVTVLLAAAATIPSSSGIPTLGVE